MPRPPPLAKTIILWTLPGKKILDLRMSAKVQTNVNLFPGDIVKCVPQIQHGTLWTLRKAARIRGVSEIPRIHRKLYRLFPCRSPQLHISWPLCHRGWIERVIQLRKERETIEIIAIQRSRDSEVNASTVPRLGQGQRSRTGHTWVGFCGLSNNVSVFMVIAIIWLLFSIEIINWSLFRTLLDLGLLVKPMLYDSHGNLIDPTYLIMPALLPVHNTTSLRGTSKIAFADELR